MPSLSVRGAALGDICLVVERFAGEVWLVGAGVSKNAITPHAFGLVHGLVGAVDER